MRICLSNSFYLPNIIGGAEISVIKLAMELNKIGHDVHILCIGDTDETVIIDNINIHRIKIINICSPMEIINNKVNNKIKKSIFILLDMYNILNSRKICNVIKNINPDVIHSNNIFGISSVLWNISKKLKIPIVQTLRDYYLLESKSIVLENLKKYFYRINSKNVDLVTAPSKYTLNRFIENKYFKKSIHSVVYNAVDIDKNMVNVIFEEKKRLIKNKKNIRFVFLGRLEKEKGIKFLIDSFKEIKFKNIELAIAGDGSMKHEVIEYSKSDSRINYLGKLNEDQVNRLLMNSDVLIIPSLWPEPFGRVVIEAYKFSIPVIGTINGGIPEIIDDNITGKLVNKDDSTELKSAIEYFSDNNNILNLMENCRNKVFEYNIKKQAQFFIKLYNELIYFNRIQKGLEV